MWLGVVGFDWSALVARALQLGKPWNVGQPVSASAFKETRRAMAQDVRFKETKAGSAKLNDESRDSQKRPGTEAPEELEQSMGQATEPRRVLESEQP